MRIGMVCPYSLDVPGGVQSHVLQLAEVMNLLEQAEVMDPLEQAKVTNPLQLAEAMDPLEQADVMNPLQQAEAMNLLEQAGAELVQQWLQRALPGRAIMIEDMLSEDNVVAARLTIDRSHQGFCFARIAEGKVAETWHNFDQLGLK